MSEAKQSKFGTLTRQNINKAVENASNDANIPQGKLVLITESLYDDAMAFLMTYFVPSEPLSQALGCGTCPDDWRKKWYSELKFNMSLAIINKDNDEMMAVFLLTTDTAEKANVEPASNEHPAFKLMMSYLNQSDKEAHFYEHFGMKESVFIREAAIASRYRNHGLGHRGFEIVIKFIKQLGTLPILIKVGATLNYSQRIFAKLGFENVYEKIYSDYTIDGKGVIGDTGEHKSRRLYGKLINDLQL